LLPLNHLAILLNSLLNTTHGIQQIRQFQSFLPSRRILLHVLTKCFQLVDRSIHLKIG
jgi:hypothetical protein